MVEFISASADLLQAVPLVGEWFAKEMIAVYGALGMGWVLWWIERRDARAERQDYEKELKQINEAYKTLAAETNRVLGSTVASTFERSRSDSELAAALRHLSDRVDK